MARRKSLSRSSTPPPTMERQISCPICYEHYDNIEAGVSCVQIDAACSHEFCRDCLHQHCFLAIQQHAKLPITCPSTYCEHIITEKQLHYVLCSESHELESCTCNPWIKYQRRMQMQGDPSLVSCTKCEALHSSSAADSNTLHCPCGNVFCLIHGDAHPNMTCEEYQNCAPHAENVLSEIAIHTTTKPCPHCDARIELYGGCEHVVCSTCHNDFCYKCGRHEYLVGDSIRTCTRCNQSYMDHRKLKKQRWKACVMLPLTLPVALLYILVATASAMASGCCCLFFGCGVFIGNDDELRPVAPKKGIKMTLIYLLWPLLDILTEFGIPVYNGWIVKGIENELGIVITPTTTYGTLDNELSTVASDVDDLSLVSSNV